MKDYVGDFLGKCNFTEALIFAFLLSLEINALIFLFIGVFK